jgi:hypothetical protein
MADIKILDLEEATEITETTDYISVVDTSDTTQDSTGTTKKATVRKLLGDRVLPDTIVGTTETQTLTDKTLSTGSVIDANVNVVEVLKKAYPIGSVYINASNATNPASLLGFGTWSAFGAGKVMVGLDAGDTSFDTAGKTGGEKTHTLTIAEMPAHKHKFGYTGGNTDATGSPYSVGKAIGHDPSNVYSETTSTGGDGSHNNLQPYIVVYFWKRTA